MDLLIVEFETRLKYLSNAYAIRNRKIEFIGYFVQLIILLVNIASIIMYYLTRISFIMIGIEFVLYVIATFIFNLKTPHYVEEDLRSKLKFMKIAKKYMGTVVYDAYVISMAEDYLNEITRMTPASLRLI